MKQRTWTHDINKGNQESEKASRSRAGLALLLLSATDVGTAPEEFIERYGISSGLAKRLRCTVEHVEARCDGGKDVAHNIAAACLFCNATRHKAKHPVAAAKHALKVRSRLAEGRWNPLNIKVAPSFSRWLSPQCQSSV